jgi:glucitol/sorbitol PTS system EIIB component
MAPMSEQTYNSVTVTRGEAGWGGPLTVSPTPDKPLIYSVTGGGIHPVAQRIADLTGGTPFDGFRGSAPLDQVAVVVVDCGGTARVGVYPMKKVLTVDVHSTTPSGPLAQFITADLFVSGVDTDGVQSA